MPTMVAQMDADSAGDQEVKDLIPTRSWQKNGPKYWLTTQRTKPAQEKLWLGKLMGLTWP